MKGLNWPRVVYCGPEDTLFKKLSRYANDFLLEAKSINFSASPQQVARGKKASVLILKIKNEFELLHQEWLSRNDASVPVIVICQNGTAQNAVHALQYGVFDYFSTTQSPELMVRRIRDAIAWKSVKTVKRSSKSSNQLLLGADSRIQEINKQLHSLAHEPRPTLVYGEPGTGKEHLAYGMHQTFCPRLPFIKYDCRLLQRISKYDGMPVSELIQIRINELRKTSSRKFVFLKHLQQLNTDQQFEILERGARSPVKLIVSYQEPIHTLFDERMIPSVSTVKIPALRQHKDDIRLIAEYFIRKASQERKIRTKLLSLEMIKLMEEYSWPGNIQELSNVVERMMLIEPSHVLTVNSWRVCQGWGPRLSLDGGNRFSSMIEDLLKSGEIRWKEGTLYEVFMQKMKRMLIDLVLPRVDYNQATAAKVLGISRNTLREKLKP